MVLVCALFLRQRTPTAMDVLNANRDAMAALQSYQAECFTSQSGIGGTLTISEHSKLAEEKPNKMRYDQWRSISVDDGNVEPTKDSPNITFASDGKTLYQQFGPTYRKDDGSDTGRLYTILEPWTGFFGSGFSYAAQANVQGEKDSSCDCAYEGTTDVEGVLCDKVYMHRISHYEGKRMVYDDTLYFGQADHLARKAVEQITFDGKSKMTRDATVRSIKVNQPIDQTVYVYKPPTNVILMSDKPAQSSTASERKAAKSGTKASEFLATDAAGKKVSLSQFRGKVVVVDFWASWCAPCKKSMPGTQAVVKAAQAAGIPVVTLAVDDGEPKADFSKWVSEHWSALPNLKFLWSDEDSSISADKYGVDSIPAEFVIDKQGIIRASFVGYGGPTDDLRNAIYKAAGRGIR